MEYNITVLLPMLIRLDGVQYPGGLIREVAKVCMKKGGLLKPDKANDLGMGTGSRQSYLNF